MKLNNYNPRTVLMGFLPLSKNAYWRTRQSGYKRYIFLGLFFLAVVALHAQQEAYLKEKVRDPHIRAYLEKQLAGTATDADLRAIQAYYHDRQQNVSRAEELIEEGAEPHIVIHPTNKDILALTFMQVTSISGDYPVFISQDGGASWTKSSFSSGAVLDSMFPGNMLLGGGDPILAFDEDGTLYMSYIYVHGNLPNLLRGDLFYVYSQDTGSTFIVPPIEDHVVYQGDIFATDMLDRQWMDLDNTGGPYDGNLYLSAFYLGGALNTVGQLVLTKPADSSRFNLDSVATAVSATTGNVTQFGNVQVDQSGRVHLSCAFIDEVDAGGLVYHTVSLDGGKTFGTPTEVGTGVLLAPSPGFTPNSVIHDRENAAINMAVDGDYVYIVWTDLGNDASRAYFSYSHDAGANFSQQLEFGNELLDTATFHFMPNVAADSGNVTLSWYSVDKSSGVTNYYMAESANAGMSFDSVRMVSDTSSFFVGGSDAFYGDYNSSVKDGCTTWTVWSDGRSGAPDIYVAKTRLCDYPGTQLTSIAEVSPVSQDFQVGKIWPNPATEGVHVELQLSKPQLVQVEVYDLQGKWVKSFEPEMMMEGASSYKVDVADFAPGQYLLKITSASGLFASRILVKQ